MGAGPGHGAPPAAEREQLRVLAAAIKRAGFPLEQLWLRYLALGGDAGPVEIEAYLQDLMSLPTVQRDMLAQAVNERLDELGWTSRVPFLRAVAEAIPPGEGALDALTGLLDGSRRAPPERLPALAAAAGRALGVRVEIYLVDDDQRRLVPLRPRSSPALRWFAVDGTAGGRAYRTGDMVAADTGVRDPARLWVPLLDGLHRLGVLDVLPIDASVADPRMLEHCRWLAAALGRLITAAAARGDALDGACRPSAAAPVGDLVRRLLPPLTAGTETFVVAGMVLPGANGGGDAFDYSLSETAATFAIFQSMTPVGAAGIVTAAALGAYRTARREGLRLPDQARLIDRAVSAQQTGAVVTGVLGALDLHTGRLHYLLAGHPPPRLCRDGTVVGALRGGRRPALGVGGAGGRAGVATLRAGDLLALHTGGVTSVRNRDGAALGDDGFTALLAEEAAAGRPPPEVARRLIHRVVDHQHGTREEDAAVLLACWQGAGVSV